MEVPTQVTQDVVAILSRSNTVALLRCTTLWCHLFFGLSFYTLRQETHTHTYIYISQPTIKKSGLSLKIFPEKKMTFKYNNVLSFCCVIYFPVMVFQCIYHSSIPDSKVGWADVRPMFDRLVQLWPDIRLTNLQLVCSVT